VDYLSANINTAAIAKILGTDNKTFADAAQDVFQFQKAHNTIYRQWCQMVYTDTLDSSVCIMQIPFLPISFFKTHELIVSDKTPAIVFSSSGTTGMVSSKHLVYSLDLYKASFSKAFKLFYGDVSDWAIIGLLPSYLEKQGSSLVLMTEELIRASGNIDSGLFLHDFETLAKVLERREAASQKTWLIGVTYALIDFAERFPIPLKHTVVLETGGMKGRKKEMTRMEVQTFLKDAFQLENIHSEYGMTELLSQAYSTGNSIFKCPAWMKVLVRDEDDPMLVKTEGTGALCIIDLANVYSCSFIATEDLGKVYPDGSFEVLGRLDNSDIRGCSLLSL